MKVYDNSGGVLIEVQSLKRNGDQLEFIGIVMGTMPVQGKLNAAEARKIFGLINRAKLWLFLLTFIFRRSVEADNNNA